jgi:hypothetical protein
VAEARAVLGDEGAQVVEDVARHFGVGVLVDGEARRRVADEECQDALARARLAQAAAHLVSELDHLLALSGAHFDHFHKIILVLKPGRAERHPRKALTCQSGWIIMPRPRASESPDTAVAHSKAALCGGPDSPSKLSFP